MNVKKLFFSVKFSPFTQRVVGGTGGTIQQRSSSTFISAGGHREQLWHGHGRLFFDDVHPAFLLPTEASSTLQDALKDGFERLSWRVACPSHSTFPRMTEAVPAGPEVSLQYTACRQELKPKNRILQPVLIPVTG